MKYTKLWALTLVFALGDLLTTVYGIRIGLIEQNGVVYAMMNLIGVVPAMLVVKSGAISVAGFAHKKMVSHEWVCPFSLAIVWGPVTVWNIVLIYHG